MSRRAWIALPLVGLLALWLIVTLVGSSGRSAPRPASPVAAPSPTVALAPPVTTSSAPAAPSVPAPAAEPARTEVVSFDSRAMGGPRDYLVWLPPGYDSAVRRGRRFPVLYLLHGSPGNPQDLLDTGGAGTTLQALIAAHRARPTLLIIPDGRMGGDDRTDGEWADTRAGRFGSLLIDIVGDVDRRFATLASRLDRGVAGYSEGGYGAVSLALRRPDLFSVVESWSGYFTQTPTGPFAGSSSAQLAASSPSAELAGLAGRLGGGPLSAWIYTGGADRGALDGETFAQNLAAAGAHVRAEVHTGDHNWPLWSAYMGDALLFASDAFGHVTRPASDLRLASPTQLAADRSRYLDYLQTKRVSYCAAHGRASRPYCANLG